MTPTPPSKPLWGIRPTWPGSSDIEAYRDRVRDGLTVSTPDHAGDIMIDGIDDYTNTIYIPADILRRLLEHKP